MWTLRLRRAPYMWPRTNRCAALSVSSGRWRLPQRLKGVTLAGIAHRTPGFSEAEIHREWLAIVHGESVA